MTPQQIDAMKLALEALQHEADTGNDDAYKLERDAIKEALAQPEQEPLEYWNAVEGWVKVDEVRQHFDSVGCGTIYKTAGEGREPVYTTPPRREWVGLTDEERAECWRSSAKQSAINIEAKLKELNT